MARAPKNKNLHILSKEKLYGDLKERIESEPTQKNNALKPRCPGQFNREEKKIWKHLARILEQFSIFNLANATALELLAKNIA